MARLGPPFWPQKIRPEKVYVGPFLASFPRKWGTSTIFGGQNGMPWVGAKKFVLKKFMCVCFSPIQGVFEYAVRGNQRKIK